MVFLMKITVIFLKWSLGEQKMNFPGFDSEFFFIVDSKVVKNTSCLKGSETQKRNYNFES